MEHFVHMSPKLDFVMAQSIVYEYTPACTMTQKLAMRLQSEPVKYILHDLNTFNAVLLITNTNSWIFLSTLLKGTCIHG